MIRGVVSSNLEAWVDLVLVSSDRHSVGFSAVIDTGFSDLRMRVIADGEVSIRAISEIS